MVFDVAIKIFLVVIFSVKFGENILSWFSKNIETLILQGINYKITVRNFTKENQFTGIQTAFRDKNKWILFLPCSQKLLLKKQRIEGTSLSGVPSIVKPPRSAIPHCSFIALKAYDLHFCLSCLLITGTCNK